MKTETQKAETPKLNLSVKTGLAVRAFVTPGMMYNKV